MNFFNLNLIFCRTLANIGRPSNDLHSNTQLYNSPSLLPLTKRQRRLVTKNPGTILALMKGARMAIDECKHQFRNRRWNCPTYDDDHGRPIFGKILQKGKSVLHNPVLSKDTSFLLQNGSLLLIKWKKKTIRLIQYILLLKCMIIWNRPSTNIFIINNHNVLLTSGCFLKGGNFYMYVHRHLQFSLLRLCIFRNRLWILIQTAWRSDAVRFSNSFSVISSYKNVIENTNLFVNILKAWQEIKWLVS